jgi:tetratricopeptide (TPR) repeat protein
VLPGAIRDYGAARLAEAGEREKVHRRLRDYVLRLGEYMTSIGTARVPATWPVLQQVFRTCDAEIGNIRAVLAWCLERGDAEKGLRICTEVRLCWLVRGALAEGAGWLQPFLDTRPAEVSASVRGPALVVRAQLALAAGDLERAGDWAGTGLAQCQQARDPRFTAAALDVLARTALASGRPQEALRRAAEAVEETRASDDWWNRGFALGSLASALAAMGCLAEARQWAETGLALMLEIDNQWGAAMFRLGLGDLARALGDPDTACGHYLAALPFVREAMTPSETTRCLARLGRIALKKGDFGQARAYLAGSLQLSLAAGSRTGIARGLLAFAALAVREDMPDRAVQLAAAATALCETAGLRPPPQAQAQRYLDAAAGLGSPETARLWAAGQKLTSREASRLALSPPPVTTRPGTATAQWQLSP